MKASPHSISEFFAPDKPPSIAYLEHASHGGSDPYFDAVVDELQSLSRLAKPTVFNVNQNERLLHGSWKVVGSFSRASTSLAQEFIRLKRLWNEETSGVSSVTRILLNYHYLKIISLGPRVIPLILAELSKKPDHWFVALAVLSDSDPTEPGLTFTEATDAWLKWGRDKGYLAD